MREVGTEIERDKDSKGIQSYSDVSAKGVELMNANPIYKKLKNSLKACDND